jgi:adenine deaminase
MHTSQAFSIKGSLVDILDKRIYPVRINVADGIISSIEEITGENVDGFIMPGFIDSHVHIESSMLTPSEFARLAVVHGTVATISDPHEIANVCGMQGVDYMIENGMQVPFKFNFGAPSCVPATTFETAGAALNSREVESLLQRPEIRYLSEMMNFPGVLANDDEVMLKIQASKRLNKPIDGHAPGLRGEQAKQYIDAGISTDHECFTAPEALDKLRYGMKILIREGSAAKNFEALVDLLNEYSDKIMFCSDDKHPDSLVEGHINKLCARAVARGIDLFKVLQAACINPVRHYSLSVGLVKEGEPADFIIVKDLADFEVLQTYIDGNLVAQNGTTQISSPPPGAINHFSCESTLPADFEVTWDKENEPTIPVIEALDGQLITNRLQIPVSLLLQGDGVLDSNPTEDILKIAVINRYHDAPIAKGWIRNFGLKEGAIASSVAHDSHNVIVTGVDNESISKAANRVIDAKGGISCVSKVDEIVLSLPIAGLMSDKDGYEIAKQYTAIDKMAKQLGSRLSAPFMTLSFMALLVIPHLKLSDKGLFNGDTFSFET